MNLFFTALKRGQYNPFQRTNLLVNSRFVHWSLLLFLMIFGFAVNAQTIPSSLTVSGACLSGSYTLTLVTSNYNSTGKPAYTGTGTVSINSTSSSTSLTLYYEPAGPAWVLAFDGQPYQANYSSPALPPMTSYTAVTDGVVGPCTGSNPLTVSYTIPSVSAALSATSICSGSPFSVTATAANFSAPATNFSLTSTPAGINVSVYPGVFTVNAPTVSSLTTYTLTVVAANSNESASTTAVITVKPTPTLAINSGSLMRPTRCDVPDGQIGFNTNLPNGTYSLSYRKDSGSLQAVSVAVASGQFSLTGLSGGQYSGFSVSNNGCVGTSNTVIFLNGATLPTVSITPSSTVVCAGQSVQLMASGATSYTWSTQQTTASISVSATGSYSVTGIASNGCSGTATASVTVNPLPTISTSGSASPTRCDVPNGQINFTTSLANGTYSATYRNGANALQSVSVAVTSGQFSLTGLVAGVYSGFSITGAGCTGTTSTSVSLTNPPNPTVTITPSTTAICAGQSTSLLASGASTYVWSTQQTTASISVSATNTYSVTGITNGCSGTATASVTVNPLPTQFSVAGGGAFCAGDGGVVVGLSGSQTGVNYQLLRDGNVVGNAVSGTGSAISFTNQTVGGTYTVLATNANTTCQQTMNGSAIVTVKQRPAAPSVNSPVVYCQNDVAQPLSATASAGGTLNWYGTSSAGGMVSAVSPTPSTSAVSSINYYVSQTVNGCESTRAGITVTVKPLPSAPVISTASGQSYPAGVSSLTASQNTGSVSLTVSGCSGGTISWNGGNATTLAVSTTNLGTQSFTATCTTNGCTSPVGIATVTVVPTTLGVLYRDADYGNTTNNIIKPYLELSNASNDPIPYSEITVRYWLTPEGSDPTNFAVYYAPLGTVAMRYVSLAQPRQGALGYVEYSFPGGGNLAPQGNSGVIENGIQKADGSNFNESDDYSYMANYQDYMPNVRITAYRNGVLFWGQEPAVTPTQTVVKVYSAAKDGTITSQIQTRLEVRNEGNTPIPVSNLKVRYYFTSDNGQLANVYVDYADIGASNVQARVVQLASPVNGADSYVELTFMPGMPTLASQSSLGAVDFRIVRSDYGLLDQSNDYSYAPNYGNVGLNSHITAYLSNSLVFGTPPAGAPARAIALEASSVLQARILGNPVMGSTAQVEISGVAGQAVQLKLVDLQGRLVHDQQVEQAGEREQVTLPLGQNRGSLLLHISTANQQQQLKVLRP